jgi:glycosyltransferase involved in cell wall biosynthesis
MTIKSTNQNILIIVDTLNKGGLAKVELDLAQSWLDKGMTVGLISLDSAQYYDLPKCHYIEFRVDQKITFRWQAIFKRQAIQKWIEQQIQVFEEKFGQANLILGAGELALRTVSKINHPAIVLSSHSSQLQAAKLPGVMGQIRLLIKTQRRSFRLKGLLNQKRIHVVSSGLAIELCTVLGVKPRQITQIYNPFDFAHIRSQSLQLTPQSQQFQQPFIIGIGEFNSRKAFHKLINAFANSLYQGDLILVGQGSESENLQSLCHQLNIQNRVHFLPFHDNHYALLKKAQLLVMTSESEGLGNVLIEALILGVPVVSTDCPHGPREIIEPFCADALVGLNDISLLSERINSFTQKPYFISEALLQRFSQDKILDQYQSLFTNTSAHSS